MTVRVQRKSYLRDCELNEDVEGDTVYQYWSPFVGRDIPASDADISHPVASRDRLDSLAKSYYGDHRLWWVIAQANDLDDPVSALHIGVTLRIPDPRYVVEKLTR
jgi:nucleoid-associated protein YgaU